MFVFSGERYMTTKKSNYEFYWKGALPDRLRLAETAKNVMIQRAVENAD